MGEGIRSAMGGGMFAIRAMDAVMDTGIAAQHEAKHSTNHALQ
jgi:hypothetical protein